MSDIFIYGANNHGKVVIDIIEKAGKHTIIGLIDDGISKGSTIFGYPILGGREALPSMADKTSGYVIAIGDNYTRSEIKKVIKKQLPEHRAIVAIHPSAIIGKGVTIAEGTTIMPGAIISCDTRIGKHCIINTRASIDHDCIISDFSSIGPGAILGGGVTLGASAVVALSANVIQDITIGDYSIVGAGATAVKDIDNNTIAYGNPAKTIRHRQPNEPYM